MPGGSFVFEMIERPLTNSRYSDEMISLTAVLQTSDKRKDSGKAALASLLR
jgi:hypothetical protein